MSTDIIPFDDGQVATVTSPALHRAAHALRSRGIAIPPAHVMSWAEGNNPEEWVDEAADDGERELRYRLVDAHAEAERQRDIERDRQRDRAREAVDAYKMQARVRRVGDEEIAEEDAEVEAARWEFSTPADFDPTMPEAVPSFLLLDSGRDVILPGVTIVFGRRGSMKSWVSYLALAQLAQQSRPALLLDYEMTTDRALRRLDAMCSQLGIGPADPRRRLVTRVQPSGPFSEGIRRRLVAQYGEAGPGAVVVDSSQASMAAHRLNPLDMSDYAAWFSEVPRWLTMQWPQTAVVIIDHLPHGADPTKATDPIGSQAKGALADAMMLVSRDTAISKQTAGSGHLASAKSRDGDLDEGDTVAEFEFGGGGPLRLAEPSIAAALGRALVTEGARRIEMAQWVAQHEGASYTVMRTALSGQGESNAALGARRDHLLGEGVIEKRGTGLYRGPGWQALIDEDS